MNKVYLVKEIIAYRGDKYDQPFDAIIGVRRSRREAEAEAQKFLEDEWNSRKKNDGWEVVRDPGTGRVIGIRELDEKGVFCEIFVVVESILLSEEDCRIIDNSEEMLRGIGKIHSGLYCEVVVDAKDKI